jgi:hypothetical protein
VHTPGLRPTGGYFLKPTTSLGWTGLPGSAKYRGWFPPGLIRGLPWKVTPVPARKRAASGLQNVCPATRRWVLQTFHQSLRRHQWPPHQCNRRTSVDELGRLLWRVQVALHSALSRHQHYPAELVGLRQSTSIMHVRVYATGTRHSRRRVVQSATSNTPAATRGKAPHGVKHHELKLYELLAVELAVVLKAAYLHRLQVGLFPGQDGRSGVVGPDGNKLLRRAGACKGRSTHQAPNSTVNNCGRLAHQESRP